MGILTCPHLFAFSQTLRSKTLECDRTSESCGAGSYVLAETKSMHHSDALKIARQNDLSSRLAPSQYFTSLVVRVPLTIHIGYSADIHRSSFRR